MSEQVFFDAKETEALLGGHVSAYTLMKWARGKEIPHRRVGRRILWTRDDIEQIKADSLVKARPLIAQSARSRAHNRRSA